MGLSTFQEWDGGAFRGWAAVWGYDPCVVRTEAPSERSDDTGEGVGRLPGRQDDEHGEEGLHGLVVYSL